MSKRFIVATKRMEPVRQAVFLAYLKDKSIKWWHWLPNFWLLKDDSETIVTDDIIRRIGGVDCLVMQIEEDIDWAASFVSNPIKQARFTKWLEEKWPDTPRDKKVIELEQEKYELD